MMPEYEDDFDAEGAGLVDEKALREILEKATEQLRGLGLTVRLEDVSVAIQNGQTVALIPALIRPSAKKKLKEDTESREAFNQMMAAENEAKITGEAKKIHELANNPEALEAFLYGDGDPDACTHPEDRIYEGLCLDCQEEIKSD